MQSIEAEDVYVTAAEAFCGMSLADAMPRHKIRLEKEKEAAIAANEPRIAPRRTFEEQPPLESMLVPHKSQLQKDKEAAIAANETRRTPRHTVEEQPPLESMLTRRYSRIQREKQAAASESVAPVPEPKVRSGPKTRLQQEKEAAVRLASQAATAEEFSAVEEPGLAVHVLRSKETVDDSSITESSEPQEIANEGLENEGNECAVNIETRKSIVL